jgi:hypothetical protein
MQLAKRGVVYAVRAEELKKENWGQPVQLIVGNQLCTGILKEGPERGNLKNLHC